MPEQSWSILLVYTKNVYVISDLHKKPTWTPTYAHIRARDHSSVKFVVKLSPKNDRWKTTKEFIQELDLISVPSVIKSIYIF